MRPKIWMNGEKYQKLIKICFVKQVRDGQKAEFSKSR
jgi:hypothetical protein